MPSLILKPTHKAVTAYYASLAKFARLGIKHETAVRSAFQELLEHCARQFDWKLVPEYRIKRKGQADASADGAIARHLRPQPRPLGSQRFCTTTSKSEIVRSSWLVLP